MQNYMEKRRTDWSSLWKKEDWWAIWSAFLILILGIAGWLPSLPSISKWTGFSEIFPNGWETIGTLLIVYAVIAVLTIIASVFMGFNLRRYIAGFSAVFVLAFLSMIIGKYLSFGEWGLETVLWSLLLGLIISNFFKIPEWMKAGARTEFFIKVGLVLLGAEILFSTIIKGGLVGMGQALLVVIPVWFFAFWAGRKFGLGSEFSSLMASGVSICGVSATIAAGGAIKGNPRHVSHVISLVLLVAMPMLVGMPFLARAIGLPPEMAGAWIGGTIDTTGAVVAAGTITDPVVGLQVASLVKMAQNVLIGFAAFFLAIWATFSLHKNDSVEKPRIIEIWYRFPKFILGFVAASLVLSFIVEPLIGIDSTKSVLSLTKGYRGWFFALAFVSIGLETRFKDLIALGKGKPAIAFISIQIANIFWTLLIVWLLWSGTFFTPPIK